MIKVYCLEDHQELLFSAKSTLEAINKCLYYLNLKRQDTNASIIKTRYGFSLSHSNKTYWAKDLKAV